MPRPWLKRSILLLLGSFHFIASAAEMLPLHLTGTWGTAEALYEGTDRQTEVYLLSDGFGIAVGSTPAAQRVDGISDGKPGPRAIIGFPVEAALNGDILMLRPLLPAKTPIQKSGSLGLSCRHDSAGPTLTCTGPDGSPIILKRRSEAVSAETTQQIHALRTEMR